MTLGGLKGMIKSDTNLAPTSQHIYHNGVLLTDDSKTLQELQISDGDMLAMHVRDLIGQTGVPVQGERSANASLARQPRRADNDRSIDAEIIRLRILGNPLMRQEIRSRDPELADAVENSEQFRRVYMERQRRQMDAEREHQEEMQKLYDDPFNVEAQTKIEELIRRDAVMENLQNALEHTPEGKYIFL
jgi:DNA damage-inducible protein 1